MSAILLNCLGSTRSTQQPPTQGWENSPEIATLNEALVWCGLDEFQGVFPETWRTSRPTSHPWDRHIGQFSVRLHIPRAATDAPRAGERAGRRWFDRVVRGRDTGAARRRAAPQRPFSSAYLLFRARRAVGLRKSRQLRRLRCDRRSRLGDHGQKDAPRQRPRRHRRVIDDGGVLRRLRAPRADPSPGRGHHLRQRERRCSVRFLGFERGHE